MKTNLKFIGIDVSKHTLDICILTDTSTSLVIKNTKASIGKFFSNLLKDTTLKYHICMENTGRYSWTLIDILTPMLCKVYVVNPLHLKRSLGLTRGKNDKVDAIRIAHFIKKNHTELTLFVPKRKELKLLQILVSERKSRVNQRQELLTKNKEIQVVSHSKIISSIIKKNNKLIKELSSQIKDFETEIKKLIKNDTSLNKLDNQLRSVPGIGNILSWNLLIKTNEFKTIKTPRKLACYAGVAPFANTSGISVFGRNRVSNLADKALKKLLHLGAMSAIRLDNDLAVYFNRKVEQGKNKMSVLNAVRNKMIHIVFALIKNQNFYQNRLILS
ncbi:IS110 family transposase [uncultured Kordia sp.]|uniref:IS110 family transposase n=1 Tax=uncultured Kordia sp. TaxID=507699 RepID=UPI00260D88C6|nr:IS110 family transposase [uncultured Kordia sp.]